MFDLYKIIQINHFFLISSVFSGFSGLPISISNYLSESYFKKKTFFNSCMNS